MPFCLAHAEASANAKANIKAARFGLIVILGT
jgi:hypothetical protein